MDSIRKLQRATALLRGAAEEIEIQQIDCLLTVMRAYPEALTHSEIEDATRLSQSSVSRNMKRLGVRLRKDVKGSWLDAGWGLVETRPDPYETRKLSSRLTKKGLELRAGLVEVLK